MNNNDEQGMAEQFISGYRDRMISVIIRHGDHTQGRDKFRIVPGENCALKSFKNGVVTAAIAAVQVKRYADITDEEWIKAGYRDGGGMETLRLMDPDLQDTDMVTIVDLDLESLQYHAFPTATAAAGHIGCRPQ